MPSIGPTSGLVFPRHQYPFVESEFVVRAAAPPKDSGRDSGSTTAPRRRNIDRNQNDGVAAEVISAVVPAAGAAVTLIASGIFFALHHRARNKIEEAKAEKPRPNLARPGMLPRAPGIPPRHASGRN